MTPDQAAAKVTAASIARDQVGVGRWTSAAKMEAWEAATEALIDALRAEVEALRVAATETK